MKRHLILTITVLAVLSCAAQKRPQDSVRPSPYNDEDVYFYNESAGVRFAGTFTYPKSEGPFPAVVLITGSGPQDRDETIVGHRPFFVLSDYLTRQGIAVLRYDDRGVGGSSGVYDGTDTTEDFIGDALAAVEYLRSRPEIDSGKIGLIGHSEGGTIAPMVAAQSSDIAFIVSMAGQGVTGAELTLMQAETIARAEGESEEDIHTRLLLFRGTIKIVQEEPDNNAAAERIAEFVQEALPDEDASIQMAWTEALKGFLIPFERYGLLLDPRTALMKVRCPVLAINGDKDVQVSSVENLAAIEDALIAGGNNRYTIIEFPGLNHLFQHAETGAMSEYGIIAETIAPIVLETIANWILEQTDRTPVPPKNPVFIEPQRVTRILPLLFQAPIYLSFANIPSDHIE